MKIKRPIIWIMAIVLCLTMTACVNSRNKVSKENPLVVMVTDVGGLGDDSLNDSVWEGCIKAKKKCDIDVRCLESRTKKDIVKNINQAHMNEASVIICVGYENSSLEKKMADKYRDTSFILVDSTMLEDNVTCIRFDEEEGSFLAGIAASMNTKTDTVGFIGGAKNANIARYEYGFKAGVETGAKERNKSIKVIKTYTSDQTSEKSGSTAANSLIKNDADVIFNACGQSAIGALKVEGNKNIWAIGADMDVSKFDKKHVLCSMVKDAKSAVYKELKSFASNDMRAGINEFGIANDGIYISDDAGNLTAKDRIMIGKSERLIKGGRMDVPYDSSTYSTFQIPKL